MADVLKLGIVDDHKLFRKGLINLIELAYPKCEILFEADNGLDLQQKLIKKNLPEIIIMDVNMPAMDGFASAQWLKENHPDIKVLVVSMVEKEETIVRMLKLGVKGYLSKDVEPQELGEALRSIMNRGFYYTDYLTGKLVMSIQSDGVGKQKIDKLPQMNDREKLFLELACSELTYNEIADKMFLSPKTIDGYRNSLFEKLNVKSRVGLALYAIRHGLVPM